MHRLKRIYSIFFILAFTSSLIGIPREGVQAVSSGIVISQVYGGGGEYDSVYTNDFVELFNQGPDAINVTGWTVQTTYDTNSDWSGSATVLSGVIEPGQYYLVQERSSGNNKLPLPAPDNIGDAPMHAQYGNVALVNNNTPLVGECPTGVVDFVNYGSAVTCVNVLPAATPSHTTAAIRNENGCTNTESNAADFSINAPNPRNSASMKHYCVPPTNPSGVGSANPEIVVQTLATLLQVDVTPGMYPTSSSLEVTCNLTPLQGPAAQAFYDDATNGDLVASDKTFSFLMTSDLSTTTGVKTLDCTIKDAELRSADVNISLEVTALPVPNIDSLAPDRILVRTSEFNLTVNGSNFTPNSEIRWNDVFLTPDFFSTQKLTAAIPSELAATVGDVHIKVYDTGWNVYSGEVILQIVGPSFADVPATHWAFSYIETLYAAGITSGCGTSPLTYCPAKAVTRAQMAKFLLLAKYGKDYVPPAASGSLFRDVPATYWAAAWIEQLAAEGITSGCSANLYCPNNPVTRAQMAIFLLKAADVTETDLLPATGVFGDVPVTHWAAKWVEELFRQGITSGCTSTTYCPQKSVTRAQMAIFLDRAFGLPLLP